VTRKPAGSKVSAARPVRGPVERWLPALAVITFALATALIIAISGSTLGYDYSAYLAAADRILAGAPLYDTSVDVAGGFAIYLYPPPFAIAMLPFALLPEPVGLAVWLGALVAAFLVGIAILPVRRDVRWAIVLLAGLSWPFLYSIKLGQVGPLLLLAFAVAWRWRDRPAVLGAALATGALMKVQPALAFGWALATRRFRGAAAGIAIAAVVAAGSALLLGLQTWSDYVALLGRVSTPVTTPHNFTPGAIAFQLGMPADSAGVIQIAAMIAVVLVTVVAWIRLDAEASLMVTVVASQLLSPLLWDHYAMLLLLPTALLLQRRHWWAVAIPLAGWLPAPAYPLVFAVALVAPFLSERPRRTAVAVASSSSAPA
jgi:hypothetical protein